ncbi:hypothetical protein [Microbulbifer sp. NBRC 101763]|uniref:hypothetical protein n=1 Tax=Microbulbifer sp. NBRC 101763 TaxID=1113820 RepID=UPI00334135F4
MQSIVAAGNAVSASARIILILPTRAEWRQFEKGAKRELCLRQIPTQHFSLVATGLDEGEQQKPLSLGAGNCLSEVRLKDYSQLVITEK